MRIPELVRRVREARPGSRAFSSASRELAGLAFSEETGVAGKATRAIFAAIVEPWSDRFERSLCDAYAAFMSEVLYAPGCPIAGDLRALGFARPEDLQERYQAVRTSGRHDPIDRETVKTVAILSRVTLGADVAVTSTVVRAALEAFPNARIECIGPRKNLSLLGFDERVSGRVTSYGRSALLGDRLQAWTAVRDTVQRCIAGLDDGEWLVVDPDSRLTQLGLLPVADDRHYRFWEGRSESEATSLPLSRLVIGWCCFMWDINPRTLRPGVRLLPEGQREHCRLHPLARDRAASASFGVGGRVEKSLGEAFENRLLAMLNEKGYSTVLDCGAGEAELQSALGRARAFRGSSVHLNEGDDGRRADAELVTWNGSLEGFGTWVQGTRVYVGYDSAAGHVAAALGVPTIVVFAGAPSERFVKRWTPTGPGIVKVIPAEGPEDAPEVLREIDLALDSLDWHDGAGPQLRAGGHGRD